MIQNCIVDLNVLIMDNVLIMFAFVTKIISETTANFIQITIKSQKNEFIIYNIYQIKSSDVV